MRSGQHSSSTAPGPAHFVAAKLNPRPRSRNARAAAWRKGHTDAAELVAESMDGEPSTMVSGVAGSDAEDQVAAAGARRGSTMEAHCAADQQSIPIVSRNVRRPRRPRSAHGAPRRGTGTAGSSPLSAPQAPQEKKVAPGSRSACRMPSIGWHMALVRGEANECRLSNAASVFDEHERSLGEDGVRDAEEGMHISSS